MHGFCAGVSCTKVMSEAHLDEGSMPFPTGNSQVCRDCDLDLPLDRFSRNGRKDGYRRPECRSCQHQRSKDINPNYQMTEGAVAARAAHTLRPDQIVLLKAKALKLQENECVYCTAKLTTSASHLDHRTPLSRGGTDDQSNLQVLCARCNSEKHAKTHVEYVEWLFSHGEDKRPDRRGKAVFRKSC